MLHLYFAANFACNLRCKYCYLPEYQKSGDKNTDEVAVSSARAFVEKCEREGIEIGHVVLHGAESGLLSPEAAATVANAFAQAGGYRYSVGIQSNGTLFNDDYFSRFERNADDALVFGVGISMDGPASITDPIRGKGVYRRASAGLSAANRRGYKTQILCVVGAHTVEHLDEFEAWMKTIVSAGQDIRFKPAYGAYRMDAFQQELFADWLNKTGFARYYQEISKDLCVTKGNDCFWLEIDVNGNCYSCNKAFGATGSFADWRTESLNEIFAKRRSLYANKPTNAACASCEIRTICHSGCPLDRSESGLAIDCTLKRRLLANASQTTGMHWEKIALAATGFQRSTLSQTVRRMLEIRSRNAPPQAQDQTC